MFESGVLLEIQDLCRRRGNAWWNANVTFEFNRRCECGDIKKNFREERHTARTWSLVREQMLRPTFKQRCEHENVEAIYCVEERNSNRPSFSMQLLLLLLFSELFDDGNAKEGLFKMKEQARVIDVKSHLSAATRIQLADRSWQCQRELCQRKAHARELELEKGIAAATTIQFQAMTRSWMCIR